MFDHSPYSIGISGGYARDIARDPRTARRLPTDLRWQADDQSRSRESKQRTRSILLP